MKLIECEILAFGGLRDRRLSFGEGVTEVLSENGSGKSTLAAFLKAMLYGLPPSRKQSLEENDRRRYTPWEGGRFGGSLTFADAAGRRYRIERFFAPDSFLLRDLESGLESNAYPDPVGEALFGVDAESFLRSIYMPARSEGVRATAALTAKLNNLSDEVFDMKECDDALALLERCRTAIELRRGVGGALPTARAEGRALAERLREAEQAAEAAEAARREEATLVEQGSKDNEALVRVGELLQESAARRERKKRQADRALLLAKRTEQKTALDALAALCPAGFPTQAQLGGIEGELAACRLLEQRVAAEREEAPLPTAEELKNARATEGDFLRLLTKQELGKQEPPPPRASGPRLGLPLLCGGAALLLLGGILLFFTLLGLLPLLGGAVLLLFGLWKWREEAKQATEETERLRAAEAALVSERQALLKVADALGAFCRRYGEIYDEGALSRLAAKLEARALQAREREEKQATLTALRARIGAALADYRHLPTEPNEALAVLRARATEAAALQAAIAEKDALLAATPVTEEEEPPLPAVEELRETEALLRERLRANERAATEAAAEASRRYEQAEQIPALREAQEENAALCERLLRRRDRLELAKQLLSEARDALEVRYLAGVRENFARYAARLSQDSLGEFTLDTALQIAYRRGGEDRALLYFSSGWQSVTEIALRLALCDALYPADPPFLILDDPFALLDPTRMAEAASLLRTLGDGRQILYLTCHPSRSLGGGEMRASLREGDMSRQAVT